MTFLEQEDHPYLLMTEADPPLFVGDEAILFLTEPVAGPYEVQPSVGQYRIEGGRIQVPHHAGNPFEASVNGATVDAFVASIVAISD